MPVILPSSIQIGPRATAPATIQAYLTSIGKASTYGIWTAGQGMAANSDGTGSVSSGGAVGCWAPQYNSSLNYKFIQATSANRPQYTTCSDSVACIAGNGSSWSLALESTTALNMAFTLCLSIELMNNTGYVHSQNNDTWSLYGRSSSWSVPELYHGTKDTALNTDFTIIRKATGTSYQNIIRIASVSPLSGTGWYNNALTLFSSAAGFPGSHRIRQICICPVLTALQQPSLLSLMV